MVTSVYCLCISKFYEFWLRWKSPGGRKTIYNVCLLALVPSLYSLNSVDPCSRVFLISWFDFEFTGRMALLWIICSLGLFFVEFYWVMDVEWSEFNVGVETEELCWWVQRSVSKIVRLRKVHRGDGWEHWEVVYVPCERVLYVKSKEISWEGGGNWETLKYGE